MYGRIVEKVPEQLPQGTDGVQMGANRRRKKLFQPKEIHLRICRSGTGKGKPDKKRVGAGTVREYTQEELKEKLKTAYNVEARAGHKKDHLSINLIGTVKRGSRLYDLYEDTGNSCWYSLRFITDHGIVSEYEYIFGHPERKPEKKRG